MDNDNSLNLTTDPIKIATNTISILNLGRDLEKLKLKIDCSALTDEIKNNITSIQNGDLKQIESSLYSQAIILQDYFARLLSIASLAHDFNHIQILGHLALKAQNQCRATLSALADIKNPKRATFIKQQNNALTQQVNNISNSKNSKKISNYENELLTEAPYETMDIRATPDTVKINPAMEAVETINGSENHSR